MGVAPLPAEAGPGPGPAAVPPPSGPTPDTVSGPLLPAEAVPTNPTDGLMGMMVPPGGGS